MKKRSIVKAILAAVMIIMIGAVIVLFGFFSSEERNLMLFMMTNGSSSENQLEYQVIERNESAPAPTSFEPVTAETSDDDHNINITVITEMVQNENSKMLKQATVQPNGAGEYLGWQLLADEGFEDGVNTFGPSPLSYLTTGAATNLHTQILRVAEVMDLELDDVKVEVLDKFHWEDMMSDGGAGYLGETYTNIIIESSESEESISELTRIALNAWTAGEAFGNETTIVPSLVVNGDHWDDYRAVPGTSLSDESYEEGLILTQIIDEPKPSQYFEQVIEEDSDMSFNAISNLVFEILAISESADDPEDPYLKKVTVSFNTTESETWVLYSDEFDGTDEVPKAPTSLEYLTAGTALCLTSQTTLVSAMMNLDYTDFRVEQQIDYREEDVNSLEMAGYADTVYSNVIIESDESQGRLNEFFEKSLALCFAGEAFKGATNMYTSCYLNGSEL